MVFLNQQLDDLKTSNQIIFTKVMTCGFQFIKVNKRKLLLVYDC